MLKRAALLALLLTQPLLAGDGAFLVFTFHWVWSRDGRPVESARVDVCAPATNAYQRVDRRDVFPAATRESLDPEGNTVWSVELGSLPAGSVAAAVTCALATPLRRVAPPETPRPLSAALKAYYLRQEQLLDLSATDVDASRVAAGAKAGAAARRFYDFITQRFVYDIDNRWDRAGLVLRRQSGSCSELSALFVSLCRNSGIPARRVSATVCRAPQRAGIDLVHHVWAEYFDPSQGWTPVDCARGMTHPERYFGRQDADVLASTGNAAPAAKPPRWTTWAATSQSRIRASRLSVWLPAGSVRDPWNAVQDMLRLWQKGVAESSVEEARPSEEQPGPLALPNAIHGITQLDDGVSAAAARLLSVHPAEGARTVFVRLHDALGDRGRGRDALIWLRRSAQANDASVRLQTARDLGWMPLPEAEDILVSLTRDKERQVRLAAAAAAGHVCRMDRTRDALERLSRHRDAATAQAARKALEEFDERLAHARD